MFNLRDFGMESFSFDTAFLVGLAVGFVLSILVLSLIIRKRKAGDSELNPGVEIEDKVGVDDSPIGQEAEYSTKPPSTSKVTVTTTVTTGETDTRGLDEPNMLKEADNTETVEEIFEDDDIPQKEIAAELKTKPKPKSKKKTTPNKKPASKKITTKPKS